MPGLEEGKLIFKEKLANKKINWQYRWLGKKENLKVFVKFCAMTKETEMPYMGHEQVLSVEMLSKTSTLKNVHLIRWGIFKICD